MRSANSSGARLGVGGGIRQWISFTKMLQMVHFVTLPKRSFISDSHTGGTRVKAISFTPFRRFADFHETRKCQFIMQDHYTVLYTVIAVGIAYFLKISPHIHPHTHTKGTYKW